MAKSYKLKMARVSPQESRALKVALSHKLEMEIARKGLKPKQVEDLARKTRSAAINMASGYFTATLKTIGKVLDNPQFPKIEKTGLNIRKLDVPINLRVPVEGSRKVPPRINEKVQLVSGRVSGPFPWKYLNPRYAASTPTSRTFWYKTGRLAELYRLEVLSLFPGLSETRNFGKSGLKLDPTFRAKKIHAHIRINYPPLPDKLDRLLRHAFVSRKAQYVPVKREGLAFSSLVRFQLPEAQRPMFSLFAARMGNRLITAMKDL